MNKKCPNCRLVNFSAETVCSRCGEVLTGSDAQTKKKGGGLLARAAICLLVCIAVLIAFYLSLIFSAKRLNAEQKAEVGRAIDVLEARGFSSETFLLRNLTAFRGNDNWLNSMVAKENAYAATNFPFEIMTLYSDFFAYPIDDVERAAILLHEAEHLKGKNEHDAYKFVWGNRVKLDWTRDKYISSPVWQNIRKQTKDNVPEMFNCADSEFGDCTEIKY